MVRTLIGEGVPNIVQPSAEYPFGKFKNKTSASSNDGTEVSERVLGDCYQGMLNTIIRTGATPNNQPETAFSSQFADAVELLKPVGIAVIGSDDGSTFGVLASKTRDPAITFSAGCFSYPQDTQYLEAYFRVRRSGSTDTSHRYIVMATPACRADTTSRLFVTIQHMPYFSNSATTNLMFFFPQELSTELAKYAARAILTIYDAGPVV